MATSIKLDQKRLEHLRQSLYGKQRELVTPNPTNKRTETKKDSSQREASKSDTSPALGTEAYITRDLIKVAFLSTLAILLQLLIHAALVNNWIHINFYGITYS